MVWQKYVTPHPWKANQQQRFLSASERVLHAGGRFHWIKCLFDNLSQKTKSFRFILMGSFVSTGNSFKNVRSFYWVRRKKIFYLKLKYFEEKKVFCYLQSKLYSEKSKRVKCICQINQFGPNLSSKTCCPAQTRWRHLQKQGGDLMTYFLLELISGIQNDAAAVGGTGWLGSVSSSLAHAKRSQPGTRSVVFSGRKPF